LRAGLEHRKINAPRCNSHCGLKPSTRALADDQSILALTIKVFLP
jgi:hypothetical protein